MLNDKVILVTGGTGSFGNRFVEYVLENYGNAGPDPFTGMLQMLRKCYEERLGNAIDEVIIWSYNS